MSLRHSRGSAAGNIITLLLLLGIIGLGAWLWLGKKDESKPASEAQNTRARVPDCLAALAHRYGCFQFPSDVRLRSPCGSHCTLPYL